jgi:hypothetical protein
MVAHPVLLAVCVCHVLPRSPGGEVALVGEEPAPLLAIPVSFQQLLGSSSSSGATTTSSSSSSAGASQGR